MEKRNEMLISKNILGFIFVLNYQKKLKNYQIFLIFWWYKYKNNKGNHFFLYTYVIYRLKKGKLFYTTVTSIVHINGKIKIFKNCFKKFHKITSYVFFTQKNVKFDHISVYKNLILISVFLIFSKANKIFCQCQKTQQLKK